MRELTHFPFLPNKKSPGFSGAFFVGQDELERVFAQRAHHLDDVLPGIAEANERIDLHTAAEITKLIVRAASTAGVSVRAFGERVAVTSCIADVYLPRPHTRLVTCRNPGSSGEMVISKPSLPTSSSIS
ncbi:hypothetical protein [Endothiovibrio diazotrophicus]